MPSAKDAAEALGTISVLKMGSRPRVRRLGSREWKDAPVGTKVYGGDLVEMRKGEGSIRHPTGDFTPLRKGSLTKVETPKRKAKRKKREIVSGEAHFKTGDK